MDKLKRKYKKDIGIIGVCCFFCLLFSCSSDNRTEEVMPIGIFDNGTGNTTDNSNEGNVETATISVLSKYFNETLDLENLYDYAGQQVPNYIQKDNSEGSTIENLKATLGRVLFYDKQLSTDNTISCSSCHKQSMAFGDDESVSTGVNGKTIRHSMRLINSKFATETRFFWDKRANSLEEQSTQPIKDHLEMGFSGEEGAPSFNDLLVKLGELDYYQELFNFTYGDQIITEDRIQESLAQFIRSIQSFDSKYDIGRTSANNDIENFNNFTNQENLGKQLFFDPPNRNGAGCITCHRAPEFDIDPDSRNNGVIGVFGSDQIDLTNTRSPTLRDVFNNKGQLNGPLMHDASKGTFQEVVEHYNSIDGIGNNNLDRRLSGGPGQNGQQLNLTATDKEALEAFIKTLSGTDIYTNSRWSDPFL